MNHNDCSYSDCVHHLNWHRANSMLADFVNMRSNLNQFDEHSLIAPNMPMDDADGLCVMAESAIDSDAEIAKRLNVIANEHCWFQHLPLTAFDCMHVKSWICHPVDANTADLVSLFHTYNLNSCNLIHYRS